MLFTIISSPMLGLFGKKKISVEKLSNILLNFVFEFCDQAYTDVEDLIKNSQEFVRVPELPNDGKKHFLVICLVGNMSSSNIFLEPDIHKALKSAMVNKAAEIFEYSPEELHDYLKEYKQFMIRVNHPSKNMIYAMSKALFHKLNLNDFQEEYFASQKEPNPMFQKRLDEVMTQSIFNWDDFLNRYKIAL